MKKTTRISKAFYEKKKLALPKKEYWPESAKDLLELSKKNIDYVPLGGAQHISKKRITNASHVIRFGKMNDILSIDRPSMIATVEAGITWSEYKFLAKDRDLSTFEFRLYPNASTLGGIVSRRTQNRRSLWDGSLLNYAHGLRGISKLGDYQYLNAPRKASGPDLRSFWFGAEGKFGSIAELSVGLFPVQEKLVLSAQGGRELLNLPAELESLGIRSAWTKGKVSGENVILDLAFSASKRRLDAICHEVDAFDYGFEYRFIKGGPCIEMREEFESTPLKKRSEKFVTRAEIELVKNATIINASLHGYTILCPHTSKQARSKWSKKLNSLTNSLEI